MLGLFKLEVSNWNFKQNLVTDNLKSQIGTSSLDIMLNKYKVWDFKWTIIIINIKRDRQKLFVMLKFIKEV